MKPITMKPSPVPAASSDDLASTDPAGAHESAATASMSPAPTPLAPRSLKSLAETFPSIIRPPDPGCQTYHTSFPRHTPKLHRLLAHFGHEVGSKGLREELARLEVEYQTLQLQITRTNPRLRKERQKAAQAAYSKEPTPENFAAMQAEQFDPRQAQMEFEACKNAAAAFSERAVKPVVVPVLQEALSDLMGELPGLREVDKKLSEDLEVPFEPSLTLRMAEAAAYRLQSLLDSVGLVPNMRPADVARELGITLDA